MAIRRSHVRETGSKGLAELPVFLVDEDPDLREQVVWLRCRGKTRTELIPELQARLSEGPGFKSGYALVIEELDHLEDSVVEFLTELHGALKSARHPSVLIDPSGGSAWLMNRLGAVPHLAVYSPAPREAKPLRILRVEAEKGSMEGIDRILRSMGHACRVARTAGEALGLLAAESFEAVLLDLGLPAGRSIGVAQFARRRHPASTIIGFASEEDIWIRDVSVRFGLRRVVPKPVSLRTVLDALPGEALLLGG